MSSGKSTSQKNNKSDKNTVSKPSKSSKNTDSSKSGNYNIYADFGTEGILGSSIYHKDDNLLGSNMYD